MYRPRTSPKGQPRRGIILLVVLVMLTLFTVVGLTFVFFADTEASSSQATREAEVQRLPDIDPEMAFSLFLKQFVFDVTDDGDDINSALRGHSLARSMYGFNYTINNDGTITLLSNDAAFNGTGRLHLRYLNTDPAVLQPNANNLPPNKPDVDDYYLVNYRFFPADGFLRDPERPGYRKDKNGVPVGPRTPGTQDNRGYNPFTGGFNAPYTYPDLNNMYLAAVKAADGSVLVQSFYRPWIFDPTGLGLSNTNNPNWTNAIGKYLILRPRPIDNLSQFPYPEDNGGDVKNLISGPGFPYATPAGLNDSIWLDLNAPIIVLPDGRKVKPLFAPLIMDLDNKLNLNVAGNIKGDQGTHVSNQGWGPWEMNVSRVLINGNEWQQLFLGRQVNAGPPSSSVYGRYGPDQKPTAAGNQVPNGRLAHPYGQVDYDAVGLAAGPQTVLLPGSTANGVTAPATSVFPYFSPTRYLNGDTSERTNHPALYNPFKGAGFDANNDDRVFAPSEMAALLRYGDTGSEFLTSDLMRLCPQNFVSAGTASRNRLLVTTLSMDRDVPGITPWAYNLTTTNPNIYAQDNTNNTTRIQAPVGSPIPFPSTTWRDPTQANAGFPGTATPLPSEFNPNDWRGLVSTWQPAVPATTPLSWKPLSWALGKVDLNRTLTPYPNVPQGDGNQPQTLASYNARFDDPANTNHVQGITAADQFMAAQADRQRLADDIYRRLLAVAAVPPVADPTKPPLDAELVPRRWLAQLAVNIVDYIDDDDISTPFNFYTTADGITPAEVGRFMDVAQSDPNNPEVAVPRYWVFGTELPHVVINEALAETQNASITQATPNASVKVWAELYNVFQAPGQPFNQNPMQPQDGFPVTLVMPQVANSLSNNNPAYAPYRVVLAAGDPAVANDYTGVAIRQFNDNVLGVPTLKRAGTLVTDFTQAQLINGQNQQGQPAYIPASTATAPSFFLLGPPTLTQAEQQNFRDPFVPPAQGTVPPQTPVKRTANMTYTVNFLAGATTDERTSGVAVLLRRLVNPHIPWNPNPVVLDQNQKPVLNVWYNPYMTVDYMDKIPLRDLVNAGTAPYASRGKRQPYGAFTKLQAANVYQTAKDGSSPVVNQNGVAAQNVKHSFGQTNDPLPATGRYDWLVHLDRQLISPPEVMNVSAYQPYQLTQRFVLSDTNDWTGRFGHLAPWFDPTRRLYRIFEFLYTHPRTIGLSTWPGARIPGRINLNTVWDQEIIKALCDRSAANDFIDTDVDNVWTNLIRQRSPGVATGGVPGQNDQPFWSLATGYSQKNTDLQNPNGTGIDNTLFRIAAGTTLTGSEQRLFQPAFNLGVPTNPNGHPYIRNELLTKVFNNVTTRSNVFAVWVTVGFFEVVDGPVTATTQAVTASAKPQQVPLAAVTGSANGTPWDIHVGSPLLIDPGTVRQETVTVQALNGNVITAVFTQSHGAQATVSLKSALGAEFGKAEGRNVRHRMFSIVDRTQLSIASTTITGVQIIPNTNQFVPFQPPYAMATLDKVAVVGNNLVLQSATGNIWPIQLGSQLEIGTGPNAQVVTVADINVANKTVSFYYQRTPVVGDAVNIPGNPGPPARFDPHASKGLVPYFAIVD